MSGLGDTTQPHLPQADFAAWLTVAAFLILPTIPTELVPQFAEPRRAIAHQIHFGLALIILGLFQKVVLADGFLDEVRIRFLADEGALGLARLSLRQRKPGEARGQPGVRDHLAIKGISCGSTFCG